MNTNKKRIILFTIVSIILCTTLIYKQINNSSLLFADATGGEYVAEDPCSENSIKKVLKLYGYLLMIAKIAVPLIIVGFGTYDLFKSVIDKDEKSLTKQLKQLGIRIFTGMVVFFIPNIVNAAFSMSDTLGIIDTSEYKECADCLLEPTNSSKCSTE